MNQNRGEVLLEEPNLYNAVNWLTMGAADTVSGAIAPEEPLSLQHWMDSYATVMAGYGAWKSGKSTVGKTNTVKTLDSMDESSYSVVKSSTAEEINDWWNEKGYNNPPYKPGTTVHDVVLNKDVSFVRVYDNEFSSLKGGWIMRPEDIKGLSPAQIQEKFALPTTPRYIGEVKLKAGDVIRVGEVNRNYGFNGGGMQFDLKGQYIGEFSEIGDLIDWSFK